MMVTEYTSLLYCGVKVFNSKWECLGGRGESDGCVLGHVADHRYFGRQPLHAGCSEEPLHARDIPNELGGLCGAENRPTVRDDKHIWVDPPCGSCQLGNSNLALVEGERGLRADHASCCQPHVRHNKVSLGLRHCGGLFGVCYVGCGEKTEFVCSRDHVNLAVESESGFFQVRANDALVQAHGRVVLHPREATVFHLPKESPHVSKP